MKPIRLALAAAAAVIVALWWAVMPPRLAPPAGAPIEARKQLQCPAGSRLVDKLCVCAEGSSWNGAACAAPGAAPGVVSEQLGATAEARNSLFFARQRVPSLPYNLNTWSGKVGAINARAPRPGSVAFIEAAEGANKDAGHVAIVESVREASLTIIEGNDLTGTVTRRTATGRDLDDAARRLHIVGYYQPH